MLGEFSGYKTLEMSQVFTLSFEPVSLDLCRLVKKKMAERSSLGDVASYVNAKGEEAVGRRVRPERTRVERAAMRMAERRQETWRPLNRRRVAAFIQLYLLAVVYDENAYRHSAEKRKSQKNFKRTTGEADHPLYLPESRLDLGRDYVANQLDGFS